MIKKYKRNKIQRN